MFLKWVWNKDKWEWTKSDKRSLRGSNFDLTWQGVGESPRIHQSWITIYQYFHSDITFHKELITILKAGLIKRNTMIQSGKWLVKWSKICRGVMLLNKQRSNACREYNQICIIYLISKWRNNNDLT